MPLNSKRNNKFAHESEISFLRVDERHLYSVLDENRVENSKGVGGFYRLLSREPVQLLANNGVLEARSPSRSLIDSPLLKKKSVDFNGVQRRIPKIINKEVIMKVLIFLLSLLGGQYFSDLDSRSIEGVSTEFILIDSADILDTEEAYNLQVYGHYDPERDYEVHSLGSFYYLVERLLEGLKTFIWYGSSRAVLVYKYHLSF